MKNKQTMIRNGSYLDMIYIAENWDQNYNGHKNHLQDDKKPSQ